MAKGVIVHDKLSAAGIEMCLYEKGYKKHVQCGNNTSNCKHATNVMLVKIVTVTKHANVIESPYERC